MTAPGGANAKRPLYVVRAVTLEEFVEDQYRDIAVVVERDRLAVEE